MTNDDTTELMTTGLTPTGEGAVLRSVEIELEATPEQVWEAIATARGNAGWLFPTELDGRVGGEMTVHREPYGGTFVARIVAWEPPHRLSYEEARSAVPGGDAPGEPWATELLVEAKSGGTCIVRVVSGFRRAGSAWEPMVDGATEGWRGALAILKAYVAHFLGRPTAWVNVTMEIARPPADAPAVAADLFAALGLTGLGAGDRFETPAGVPTLAGVVVGGEDAGLLLRATEPAPALVEVSGFWMGGDGVQASVSIRFFGDDAAAMAADQQPAWDAWLTSYAESRSGV